MIILKDGAVLRECLDRYWKQKRYQAIPDFIESLLDDHLNLLREKEFNEVVLRDKINKQKKENK
jgi:hypothetical protein